MIVNIIANIIIFVYYRINYTAKVNCMSKSLKWIWPAIIAPEEPLSPDECTRLSSELLLYLKQNPFLKLAFNIAVCFVNIYPIFFTGRTLRLLKPEKRQGYLNRMHLSRAPFCRGLVLLAGLPVKLIYYSQEAEQERLGFNARVLKEEANRRVVTRC